MNRDVQDRNDKILPYSDLTGKIIEACFEVINDLGSGFLESVYEKALLISLQERELIARAQIPLDVYYHGETVGKFFADIIVEETVILELKTVSSITAEHKAQIINYLKATGYEVGLLINFGNSRLDFRRFDR